jgi:hypothetical protein
MYGRSLLMKQLFPSATFFMDLFHLFSVCSNCP